VLNKMIRDGSIKLVKALYVDWHYDKVGVAREEHEALVQALTAMGLPPKKLCGVDWELEL
jgi:hypothetical protein